MATSTQKKGGGGCCVPGCNNRYDNTPKSINFYSFPRDDYIGHERRIKWINAVKRIDKLVYYYVSSRCNYTRYLNYLKMIFKNPNLLVNIWF